MIKKTTYNLYLKRGKST